MEDVTLQQLLEAGCHFGHKAERWHPKASEFIYTEKDGIHIIDLAKTRAGLLAAAEYIRELVAAGGEVAFVGTKRQVKGVLKEEIVNTGAPHLVERWIGGFLTNWDSVKQNIDKINRLTVEFEQGLWKKRPKHEQSKTLRYIKRLKVFYGGVLHLKKLPDAVVIFDVRKEVSAVREAQRRGLPIVGIVDTNSNPTGIDYVVPANDDAVGSVKLIAHVLARAYTEGMEARAKEAAAAVPVAKEAAKTEDTVVAPVAEKVPVAKKADVTQETKKPVAAEKSVDKKPKTKKTTV